MYRGELWGFTARRKWLGRTETRHLPENDRTMCGDKYSGAQPLVKPNVHPKEFNPAYLLHSSEFSALTWSSVTIPLCQLMRTTHWDWLDHSAKSLIGIIGWYTFSHREPCFLLRLATVREGSVPGSHTPLATKIPISSRLRHTGLVCDLTRFSKPQTSTLWCIIAADPVGLSTWIRANIARKHCF